MVCGKWRIAIAITRQPKTRRPPLLESPILPPTSSTKTVLYSTVAATEEALQQEFAKLDTFEIKESFDIDRTFCPKTLFLIHIIPFMTPRKILKSMAHGLLILDVSDEGGPVIEISKTCRTTPVEDGIVRINCAPLLYKLGLIRFFKNTSLWFVKDICGIVCAIFTWLLIVYAESVVMFIMLIPSPYPAYSMSNAILFNFFSFLAVASHMRAMFSDPGAVPKGNATRENIMKMGLKEGQVVYKCPKCISIKPERAHHCSVCQRCIRKMDHHCPWVNNCVGENNQKYFVLFTMYICLMSIHAIYMSVQHFIICLGKDWKECSGASAPATTVFLILLVFEGLLFGIFTAIMCGSQLSSICSDETGIEQLKKDRGSSEKRSYWLSIKSVFGHPFTWRWFSPFDAPTSYYQEARLYSV